MYRPATAGEAAMTVATDPADDDRRRPESSRVATAAAISHDDNCDDDDDNNNNTNNNKAGWLEQSYLKTNVSRLSQRLADPAAAAAATTATTATTTTTTTTSVQTLSMRTQHHWLRRLDEWRTQRRADLAEHAAVQATYPLADAVRDGRPIFYDWPARPVANRAAFDARNQQYGIWVASELTSRYGINASGGDPRDKRTLTAADIYTEAIIGGYGLPHPATMSCQWPGYIYKSFEAVGFNEGFGMRPEYRTLTMLRNSADHTQVRTHIETMLRTMQDAQFVLHESARRMTDVRAVLDSQLETRYQAASELTEALLGDDGDAADDESPQIVAATHRVDDHRHPLVQEMRRVGVDETIIRVLAEHLTADDLDASVLPLERLHLFRLPADNEARNELEVQADAATVRMASLHDEYVASVSSTRTATKRGAKRARKNTAAARQ